MYSDIAVNVKPTDNTVTHVFNIIKSNLVRNNLVMINSVVHSYKTYNM